MSEPSEADKKKAREIVEREWVGGVYECERAVERIAAALTDKEAVTWDKAISLTRSLASEAFRQRTQCAPRNKEYYRLIEVQDTTEKVMEALEAAKKGDQHR